MGPSPIETSWLQLAIAAFTGLMTALAGVFMAGWRLSGQLNGLERKIAELRTHIVEKELPETRHTLAGRIDTSRVILEEKIDDVATDLDTRLRNVETQQAALNALRGIYMSRKE